MPKSGKYLVVYKKDNKEKQVSTNEIGNNDDIDDRAIITAVATNPEKKKNNIFLSGLVLIKLIRIILINQ